MSVLDTVRSLLSGSGGASTTTFRCPECEQTFESAKSEDRAVCPDCLSHEVTQTS